MTIFLLLIFCIRRSLDVRSSKWEECENSSTSTCDNTRRTFYFIFLNNVSIRIYFIVNRIHTNNTHFFICNTFSTSTILHLKSSCSKSLFWHISLINILIRVASPSHRNEPSGSMLALRLHEPQLASNDKCHDSSS